MRRWSGWLLVLAVLAGCADGEPAGPEEQPQAAGVPESALTFVRFRAGAKPDTTHGSFWAVKGQDRRLILRYEPACEDDDDDCEDEGEKLLEFEVKSKSLLRRPNGTPFAPGDSVRIDVEVGTAGLFYFKFQPAGLVFDASEPARLKIWYLGADPDLDGDGDDDEEDDRAEHRLQMLKQEHVGDPWFPVPSFKFEDGDEIEGKIFGFTGFAIAT